MHIKDIFLKGLLRNLADVQVKQISVAKITSLEVLILMNNFVFHVHLIEPHTHALGAVLSVCEM